MINLVVIGKGTPLFTGITHRAAFAMTGTREFKSGNVLLTYAAK